MPTSKQFIIYDGDIVSAEKPVVPVISRGLMYGDGIFETLRTYAGKAFLLDRHLNRLLSGMDLLAIAPKAEFKFDRIRTMIYALLRKQQLLKTDAIIRMQVWRGGRRGYHPQKNSNVHFSITASACPDYFSLPTLASVKTRRIPSESLSSRAKFTNSINYILAAREASQKGADEALMQTIDGWISETTIANIFWSKGKTVFTPDTDCDLIPGITREVIISIINQQDSLRLKEGKYAPSHLLRADAVWMCNSVREILPVEKIDNVRFDVDNSVIKWIMKQFKQYRKAKVKLLSKHG